MDSVILTNEALKLPAWERAQVIDALWKSLDSAEQTSIDQAWLAESHDRLQAYRDGKLKGVVIPYESPVPDTAEDVDKEYEADVRELCRKRVALAGNRLAGKLAAAFRKKSS